MFCVEAVVQTDVWERMVCSQAKINDLKKNETFLAAFPGNLEGLNGKSCDLSLKLAPKSR